LKSWFGSSRPLADWGAVGYSPTKTVTVASDCSEWTGGASVPAPSAHTHYSSNGWLDTGIGGRVSTIFEGFEYGEVTSVVAQPDGRIVAAVWGTGHFALARFN
jgi:hypothetical protein